MQSTSKYINVSLISISWHAHPQTYSHNWPTLHKKNNTLHNYLIIGKTRKSRVKPGLETFKIKAKREYRWINILTTQKWHNLWEKKFTILVLPDKEHFDYHSDFYVIAEFIKKIEMKIQWKQKWSLHNSCWIFVAFH